MDYRREKLYVNKYRVKQPCVVGKAAESFWPLASHKRRGMSSLVWSNVVTMELGDVVLRGRKKATLEVGLSRADSELALRAAHAVVNLLERNGFRVLDVAVAQNDGKGDLVGEHDLVCERRRGPSGRSPAEVKLRQLKTKALKLRTVRRQVQQEAWKLWPKPRVAGRSEWWSWWSRGLAPTLLLGISLPRMRRPSPRASKLTAPPAGCQCGVGPARWRPPLQHLPWSERR